VLYSETWGDYLCYFVVYGKDTRDGSFVSHLCRRLSEGDLPWWLQTNGYEVGRYLGRVNLVSLLPSAVLLAGVVVGLMYLGRAVWLRSPVDRDLMYSLLCLVVAMSMVGFFLYLIIYANPTGNNIKPAYVLHAFPFVAILAGGFLQLVRSRSKLAYRVMLGILLVSFLHNGPVMVTRFNTCV
jgi:hypothetical protein